MRTKALNGGNMKRTIQIGLVVALGLFVTATAFAYSGTYVPGAGINNTQVGS